MSEKTDTTNTSGAGLETVAWMRIETVYGIEEQWNVVHWRDYPFHEDSFELVRRSDAAALLLEREERHRAFVALVERIVDRLSDSPFSLIENLKEAIAADAARAALSTSHPKG